jgi:hypothetical protein
MGVIISNKPPEPKLYNKVVEAFGVNFDEGIVFTVGNTIHSKYRIPEDLMRHELVHVRQQSEYKGGYKKWWKDYLADPKFRLSQEVEAYRVQAQFIEATVKDRNEKARQIHKIASDLAGPIYGNLVSLSDAKKYITGKSHAEQVMDEA